MAEIVKAAKNLIDAALYFSTLNPSNSPRNIPAAVRCLVSALSLVIPTSLELEIRLMLGELLLSYGEDVTLGLDQFQKAYSLTQTV